MVIFRAVTGANHETVKFFDRVKLAFGIKGISKSDFNRFFSQDEETTSTVSIGNSYQKQIWVYSAVNAIAINLQRVPLKLFKGEKEIISGLEYEMLHNPWGMTLNEMIEGLATWKHIRGGAFIILQGEANNPVGLELVSSDDMTPILSGMKLTAWKYRFNNVTTIIPLENVMHFKFFNPFDSIHGMNPLNPCFEGIEADKWARDFDRSLLKNGTAVGSILESENDITPEEVNRLKIAFEQRHRGSGSAGKVAILAGGMKYRDIKLTAQDMNYIEQRKMNKMEILAAYKVPPVEVGDHENSNYSNAEAQMKQFWTKKLIPEMESIASILTRGFFKRKGIVVKPDYTEIQELQQDQSKIADTVVKYFNMGVPFNILNERFKLGFDPIEGGDTGYLPFSLQPAGMADEPPLVQETLPVKMAGLIRSIKDITDAQKKTVDKRTEIWKKFDRSLRPVERAYKSKLNAFFFNLRKETLENVLGKGIVQKAVFDTERAKKKISEISDPFYKQAILVGATGAKEDYGFMNPYSIETDKVTAYIRTKKNMVRTVVDTIDTKVSEVVAQGVAEGRTTEEIAKILRSYFGELEKYGSERIVQTEIVGASNFGRMDEFKEAGVEKKDWISSKDENVRDEHQIDGEVVGIDEEFSNGLRWPGDPNGDPGNVINCRCSVGAIIE